MCCVWTAHYCVKCLIVEALYVNGFFHDCEVKSSSVKPLIVEFCYSYTQRRRKMVGTPRTTWQISLAVKYCYISRASGLPSRVCFWFLPCSLYGARVLKFLKWNEGGNLKDILPLSKLLSRIANTS